MQTDGVNGLIARNYLKYGFLDFGLAQIVSPGPVLPAGERVYYQTHPPLAPMLGAIGIAVLGPTTEALRLPHVLLSLATVVLLAWMATRLYGPVAGLWAAWAAAALPIASTYGSAWPEPLGPALIALVVLASVLYHRYAEGGQRRDLWFLLAGAVLALAADWPAYVVAFVLAAHAFLYRTKANKRAMLALPALALLAFAGLLLYARTIPPQQNLYGSLSGMMSGWTTGEGGEEIGAYSLVAWVKSFATKYVEQFSPLALLAPIYALTRVRSLFQRQNHPDQHLLMLWAWPLAFTLVLHRIFFVHVHYHLVYLPAVAVSLAGLGRWLLGGQPSALRRVAAFAGGIFLILWSHHVNVATEDRLTPFRRLEVEWAKELARETPFEEESAFALHYAMQMRFLADRRVEENVDTPTKLEALASGKGRATRLFAPLNVPFGEVGSGARLATSYPATAGERLVQFRLMDGAPKSQAEARSLGPLGLDPSGAVEKVEWAVIPAGEGKRLVYLGWVAKNLPRVSPGETLEWRARFIGTEPKVFGTESVAANANASCFLPAPAGWPGAWGCVEFRLVHRSWDVSRLGLSQRLMRLALRMATFGLLGAPEPVERVFESVEGTTLGLSAPGKAGG